jgi:CTP:molybdopterin cytidylyltransferase MocA
MGAANKLTADIGGEPMVRHVVKAAWRVRPSPCWW